MTYCPVRIKQDLHAGLGTSRTCRCRGHVDPHPAPLGDDTDRSAQTYLFRFMLLVRLPASRRASSAARAGLDRSPCSSRRFPEDARPTVRRGAPPATVRSAGAEQALRRAAQRRRIRRLFQAARAKSNALLRAFASAPASRLKRPCTRPMGAAATTVAPASVRAEAALSSRSRRERVVNDEALPPSDVVCHSEAHVTRQAVCEWTVAAFRVDGTHRQGRVRAE